jgi:hypothetical protein
MYHRFPSEERTAREVRVVTDNSNMSKRSWPCCYLLRHPGAAVDEFTHRIQVACVASRLGDHVEDDLPQIP